MAQQFYKKIYSLSEGYVILYQALRTMPHMARSRRRKELSPEFIERIMLAVTEVNGCEVCSYGHTKMALEQGVSSEEIQKLLTGVMDGIPDDEVKAVFFAQHYADTRGHPSAASWQQIVKTYGPTKALGILGATRAIMFGNAYGIPLSAFRNRLLGKPIKKSSLAYELGMMLSIIVFLPVAAVHALISSLLRAPIIQGT
ncbi:MAG: carboxymuconolactone decarboxylase family protein [Candidatus Cryosericum sp.]